MKEPEKEPIKFEDSPLWHFANGPRRGEWMVTFNEARGPFNFAIRFRWIFPAGIYLAVYFQREWYRIHQLYPWRNS